MVSSARAGRKASRAGFLSLIRVSRTPLCHHLFGLTALPGTTSQHCYQCAQVTFKPATFCSLCMPVPTLARMARSSESWNKSENTYFCYSTLLPIPSGTLSKASVSLPPLPQAYSEFGIVAFCCKLSREVNSCLCSALSVKSTLVKKPYASTLFISVTEIHTIFPVETEHLMFVSKRYLTETCTVLCCSV